MTSWWHRIRSSPQSHRLARGGVWSLLGVLASRGLALLTSVIVARLLGQQVFGEFGTLQSTLALFATVASFGMGQTAAKYVAEWRKTNPARANRILALNLATAAATGLVAAIVLVLTARPVAEHLLGAPHLAAGLRIAASALLLASVAGAQAGALTGLEDFRAQTIAGTWASLAGCALSALGAWRWGLMGALWSLVFSQLVACWANARALRPSLRAAGLRTDWTGAGREASVLYRFSLPAALASFLVVPVNWICTIMLIHQPRGFEEMGLFNATTPWRMLLLLLPGVLSQVLLPLLSEMHGLRQTERFHRLILLQTGAVALGGLVCGLPIVLAAPHIMTLYGQGFSEGAAALVWVVAGTVLSAVLSVAGTAIASVGRMWAGFLLNALWAASYLWLTRRWIGDGAVGLARAFCFSYVVHAFGVALYFPIISRRSFAPAEPAV